jgi:ATP-binding cassette, subfamily B, bacterial CvaB/MchF/RaxB
MSIRRFRPRRIRLVRQATYFECGLACLVMVARSFGANVSLSGARKACPPSARGMTLNGMVNVAQQLGLRPVPVSINLAALSELALPAILHWGFSHYVVLAGYDGRTLSIFDPGHGHRYLPLEEAAPLITGVAIEFERGSTPRSFAESVQPLRFFDLLSERRPLFAPAALAAGISLCLELLLVLIPWLVARMLDAPRTGAYDPLLLALLALVVMTALGVTKAIRGALVIRLSGATQKSVMQTAFRRLLAKPASFFEQRYSTYIVSRFEGTDRLRTVLSEDYLNAFIDIIMLAVLLCAMGSLNMTVMTLAAIMGATVGLIRYGVGLLSRTQMDEVVHARSIERLHLMETVRSIRALKQFGKTEARETSYERRLDNSTIHQGNHGWSRAASDAGASFVSDAGWIGITLYLVAGAVQLSGPAALITLVLYSRMLLDRASLLSGKLAELSTVKVQLEHLADIVEAEPPTPTGLEGPAHWGDLRVTGLSFGYDSGSLFLENLELQVSSGEFVALEGPSGCGKTTVLKLIAGLLAPVEGSIAWSGIELGRIDPTALQHSLAFVFQDDELLEGDILGNVTLFEPNPDVARAWEACEVARIAGDIRMMPMRLQTMIGERGSALSGGQRQRLLIARALYHRPEVLLLDEATSELDVANERAIYAGLRRLGLTVIMVSHRPEAVAEADKIVRIGGVAPPEKVAIHA